MLTLDSRQTIDALAWPRLVDALSDMFQTACEMPMRHHHEIDLPGRPSATLLLMPAWTPGEYTGVKLVTVYPDNGRMGLPAIYGSYLLLSGKTGEVLAFIDGGELTARRTAAASALAARHLARSDAEELLVCGTGRLAGNLLEAHAAVRPLTRFRIWGRHPARAAQTVAAARVLGLNAETVSDLEAAARSADIISCATLSEAPIIRGAWLKPGSHLDLVGAYKPSMRESDDEAVRRAAVFVDTREGAFGEAGDLLQPLQSGIIGKDHVKADLSELVSGTHPGRQSDHEITLFKSVGAALEDLAAAILAYETVRAERA